MDALSAYKNNIVTDYELTDDDLSLIQSTIERSIVPLDSVIRSAINSLNIVSQTASCINELSKMQPLSDEFSENRPNYQFSDNIIILKKLGKPFALLFNRHRKFYDKNKLNLILEDLTHKIKNLKKDLESELRVIFENEKICSDFYPLSKNLAVIDTFEPQQRDMFAEFKTTIEGLNAKNLESKRNIVKLYLEFSIRVLICVKLVNEIIYSTQSLINNEVSNELSLIGDDKINKLGCCNMVPMKLSIFKLLSLSYHRFVIESQKEFSSKDLYKMLTIVKDSIDDAYGEHVKEFYFNNEITNLDDILDV